MKRISAILLSTFNILFCLVLGGLCYLPLMFGPGVGNTANLIIYLMLCICYAVWTGSIILTLILSHKIFLKMGQFTDRHFKHLMRLILITTLVNSVLVGGYLVTTYVQNQRSEAARAEYVKNECVDVRTPKFSYKKCPGGWNTDEVPEEHREDHLEYTRTFINLMDQVRWTLKDSENLTKLSTSSFQSMWGGWTRGEEKYNERLGVNTIYFRNTNGSYVVCTANNCQLDSEVFLTK